jgi:hypothetical protein
MLHFGSGYLCNSPSRAPGPLQLAQQRTRSVRPVARISIRAPGKCGAPIRVHPDPMQAKSLPSCLNVTHLALNRLLATVDEWSFEHIEESNTHRDRKWHDDEGHQQPLCGDWKL